MNFSIELLKKCIPRDLKNFINFARLLVQKSLVKFQVLLFPFFKQFINLCCTLFPRKTWPYQFYFKKFSQLRKFFKRPLYEYKEFLTKFDDCYQLDKNIILEWRNLVYFAHFTQNDFVKMSEKMQQFHDVQEKLAHEHELQDLNFCISSDNLFRSYNVHAYLDTHIKAKKLGMQSDDRIVLLLDKNETISNPVMLKYWEKYITVIRCEKTIQLLRPLNQYLARDLSFCATINKKPVYIEHAKAIVQKAWEEQNRAPLLQLADEDLAFGKKILKENGVDPDGWFVCLHVRDSGYKMGSHAANEEYDSYRNARIENYHLAIDAIINRGGYVIRVGDPNMIKIADRPGLFNYAHSNARSNRMDVFLFSKCRFFIGVSSGPILNPIIFGVPTIMTNFMPIVGRPHASNCLFLPKLLRDVRKGQLISFNEILSGELGRTFTSFGYKEKGIEIVENTPEELCDVVIEMMDRLDNKCIDSVEDLALQEKFKALYREHSGYGDLGKIGKNFIKKYTELGLV